ncbi:tetratricopeptide repeat protein [Portibacter marinus]|uniref:tetratricopeptide repeat protein n=1 Tax=Portibacter marinus TaxID=2898660 RepID=UPI001F2DFCF3|nr:hypothetical protein [Portibacter marinus]
MKFIRSLFVIYILSSCQQVPLEYRLQYFYTSEERLDMEARISDEIKKMYEGSLLRQSKLDTLLALNPEKEEYYRRKSFKFSQTGNFHQGYPLMEKAIQLDPANALYYTSWHMLSLYRNYEQALEDLEYYDDITQGVTYVWGENVHYLKGLAYKQMGMYDQAVSEFNHCIYIEGINTSEYVYVYRGIANLRHECLEDAVHDLQTAIDMYSNCTMAYVYLGETKIRMREWEEAKSYLWKAEELLCRGVKKTHPYFEVFDEVQLSQVYDLLSMVDKEL